MKKQFLKKVVSAVPMVKNIDGTLYGVMELEVNSPLNSDEAASIKDYIAGQYSDGWGEGFEQQRIKIKEGELFVSFWNSNHFFIATQEEFKDMLLQEEIAYLDMSL